ncbi:hypothetical protein M0811_00690 [Anaeramoeba ignava]|uniref:DUF4291 domain-containing protein n=1 Tax=Anaeramoeba ignava TaxID=1746090 RepID=A0A9Q0LJN5_ANAIG|nr:hypothetical protein M0811_00690 [Anaeramoeba ignava]
MQNIPVELYKEQIKTWPEKGKHIMANYDEESVIVYQAFNKEIAEGAVKNNEFKEENGYSLSRMTWIKTEFLWMMHRSGWGHKKNQEKILAIRIKREGFEKILELSIPTMFKEATFKFKSKSEWEKAVAKAKKQESYVCVQFDPAWNPLDSKVSKRRAIQLGLKGDIASHFRSDFIVKIYDITSFVHDCYSNHVLVKNIESLKIPLEKEYPLDENLRKHLGIGKEFEEPEKEDADEDDFANYQKDVKDFETNQNQNQN